MKKKLCALILAMACVCSLGTTGASAAGMDEQEGYSTTVISGEDAIQAYLEEVGEPYDPNLVEVIRVEYERNIENTPTPAFISREYERRNEKTRKYTDFTDTVMNGFRPEWIRGFQRGRCSSKRKRWESYTGFPRMTRITLSRPSENVRRLNGAVVTGCGTSTSPRRTMMN